MSGDPVSSDRGQPGVGTALSMRAERELLYWVPVNCRLCAVRLDGSVCIKSSRLECVVHSSSLCMHPLRDRVYRVLSQLLRSVPSTDIADDFNARFRYLASGADLLSQSIAPTTEIVSSPFVLTIDYFGRKSTFVVKCDIVSSGALPRLHIPMGN